MSFPTREERTLCWDARDRYWECLDKNGVKELKEKNNSGGPCAEVRNFYEKSCTAQWVKHFDRKRNYLQFKEKIEKEGIPAKSTNDVKVFQKRRIYQEVSCL